MMSNLDATRASLDDLVKDTGKALGREAAAVAIFVEQQRHQLIVLAARGEPGLERSAERAIGAARIFAGVSAVQQGDAFDARFAAIVRVALGVVS